jgi:hypothetical protein
MPARIVVKNSNKKPRFLLQVFVSPMGPAKLSIFFLWHSVFVNICVEKTYWFLNILFVFAVPVSRIQIALVREGVIVFYIKDMLLV